MTKSTNQKNEKFGIEPIELIKIIREEADGLKECFTRYSFQALAFSAAAFGLIARFIRDEPLTGLASIFIITFILAVARIGTFKYAGANRAHGYKLHLYRTNYQEELNSVKSTPEESMPIGWKNDMRNIGWEEALRAWRIVQATIFEKLYATGGPNTPNDLQLNKLTNNEPQHAYKWFEPSLLIDKETSYYAGSYLAKMLHLLHLMAIFGLVCLIATCIMLLYESGKPDESGSIAWSAITWAVICFILTLAMISTVHSNIKRTDSRRRLLEEGILSIHSCAIMWQAVVVAHYRAIELTKRESKNTYENYTFYLSIQAKDLGNHIFDIHHWINHQNPEDIKKILKNSREKGKSKENIENKNKYQTPLKIIMEIIKTSIQPLKQILPKIPSNPVLYTNPPP